MAEGRLVGPAAFSALDQPAEQTRAEIQQALLGDYSARRTVAVEQLWSALGWRERRRITRAQLEADYDVENVCICDLCLLVYPKRPSSESPYSCDWCDGTVVDWTDRPSITPLIQRIAKIRLRLRQFLELPSSLPHRDNRPRLATTGF